VRRHLELMADVESSGSATVYRFSERSLGRAYDDGWTAGAIAGFLSEHATKGVPQPLRYLVEDVGRRHGRLRVGSAMSYVRCDDPSLLAEIRLGRRTAKLGLRALAPTVLVSEAPPQVVAEALRVGGFLPAEEDAGGMLVVRRPVLARAGDGFGVRHAVGAFLGPPFDADSEGSVGAVPRPMARPGQPDDAQLDALVSRLLASRPPASPAPPALAAPSAVAVWPAPERGGARTTGTDDCRPASGIAMPDATRPAGITSSPGEIREMLSVSAELGWWMRLEFANNDGTRRQENVAAVKADDDKHWVVVTTGDEVTMTLALRGITWARFLTEAEEALL